MRASRTISRRNTSVRFHSIVRELIVAPAYKQGGLDRFFALAVGGVLVFIADILAGAVAYQDQLASRWSVSASIVSAENGIRTGATLALFVLTAITLFAELRTTRWSLPRTLYILGLAIMVALALRPRSLFLFR